MFFFSCFLYPLFVFWCSLFLALLLIVFWGCVFFPPPLKLIPVSVEMVWMFCFVLTAFSFTVLTLLQRCDLFLRCSSPVDEFTFLDLRGPVLLGKMYKPVTSPLKNLYWSPGFGQTHEPRRAWKHCRNIFCKNKEQRSKRETKGSLFEKSYLVRLI